MLRIGLSGGIGAGKSTVSSTFSECGGIIVDSDVIAREVVESGTEGLAALVDAFGELILLPDGALNRPALAAVAFSDDQKRATLNSIVHPLVGRRREELIASAAKAAENPVIVEDIPLLVESKMAPFFPLVIIVNSDAELRVKRLIEHRGFTDEDARARIAAQATEEERRAVADVWLDNSGSAGALKERARDLWYRRILPFARNVQQHQAVRSVNGVVPADPSWSEQAKRVIARLNAACGNRAIRIDHIGSTAVPGLNAKDVIDIQITVASLDVADKLADALLSAGYPRRQDITADIGKSEARSTVVEFDHTDDATLWRKRYHASADPGRPTHVHIRVDGWPGQQFALLFVDWLMANPTVQQDYLAVKCRAEAEDAATAGAYADAKEPWFVDAYRRAWAWADATGWAPTT